MENKEEEEAVRRERLKHYWDYLNVIATAYREGFLSTWRKAGNMPQGSEAALSVEMEAYITELSKKYALKVIQREQKKEI